MTGTSLQIVEWLMSQTDSTVVYDIEPHREKRSLSANSYFHVLADKLRQKLGISLARCKNELITSYGQVMYLDDGSQFVYKTNAPLEYVQELEEPHLKLVKTDIENGKEVYFYRVYRGSHTYNSSEMHKLIDGTIQECKSQGIETLPPHELNRMLEAWGKKHDDTDKRTSK